MDLLTITMPTEGSGLYVTADVLRDDEGRLWLVPEWRVHLVEPYRMPTRIIQLDPDEIQWTPKGPTDLLLGWPVPTAVLDGRTAVAPGVVLAVEEAPSIRIPLGTG